MYLAKFFHRAPGDDDRELMLIPSSHCADPSQPIVMGIALTEPDQEYLRNDYPTIGEAIAAFRREADKLRRGGYVETAHTDYTLRKLPSDPAPKPDWQRSLDELMLALFGEDTLAQSRLLDALSATSAAEEPLYLWIAAHHAAATGSLDTGTLLGRAKEALNALAARTLAGRPFYIWSLPPYYLEAYINDLLCELHLARGNPQAGLDAARRACDISGNQYRGGRIAWLLCEYFPEHQEEAFDQAYCHGEFGGYEAVTALPGYADYVARRNSKSKSGTKPEKGWRWSTQKKPASEAELRQVEQQLGASLPKDYRDFLARSGRTELLIRFGEESKELCFYGPGELIEERKNFFNFNTRFEKSPDQAEAWCEGGYGLPMRDLVPVAAPSDVSSCIVIHLGQGERYGWCYQWSHDDLGSLTAPQPSFEKAIEAITAGIERRDESTLFFFEIFLD